MKIVKPPSSAQRRGLIGRLVADRRAAIGITFALTALPTMMVIGAAVDYSRLEQFKTQLQTMTDSAALAGATAYVDSSSSSTASTVATNYMSSNVGLLPSHIGSITPTISAAQVTTGSNQGYTVTVSATASMGTTFMRVVASSLPVSATSVAVNPRVQITVTLNNFKSNAGDANTLYYYLISSNAPTAAPTTSSLTNQKLASNTSANNPNVTFTASASQKIGIALQNVTGGNTGWYGCTQYQTASGYTTKTQCYNHTQWFFSNIMPPSNNTNNLNGYTSVTKDCNILTALNTTIPTSLNPPSSGSCLSSQPANTSFSCADLNGQYLTQYWNDMGGTSDDKDYNDAEITIGCSNVSGVGNSATNVYLSQ